MAVSEGVRKKVVVHGRECMTWQNYEDCTFSVREGHLYIQDQLCVEIAAYAPGIWETAKIEVIDEVTE